MKGEDQERDTDELGLTYENNEWIRRSCSCVDLLMPAASAFFDGDDNGAQRRRGGAMEAGGEEEGEGRWRERERVLCPSKHRHRPNCAPTTSKLEAVQEILGVDA